MPTIVTEGGGTDLLAPAPPPPLVAPSPVFVAPQNVGIPPTVISYGTPAPAPSPAPSPPPAEVVAPQNVGIPASVISYGTPAPLAPAPSPPEVAPSAPSPPPEAIPIPRPGAPVIEVGAGTYLVVTPTGQTAPASARQNLAALAVTGGAGALDEAAQALRDAESNHPDLTNLPGFDLIDPFGSRTLAAANPPLKGGAALEAITELCARYGVDPRACYSNALREGAGGGIGDNGDAYGPFQMHATDGRLPQFVSRGKRDATVNAWAWSRNGIEYAIRSMVTGKPSAKGLTGQAAVYAIVYGFERPADEAGAARDRWALYQQLAAMGDRELGYVASQLHGPIGGGVVDTQPVTPGSTAQTPTPAGLAAQWRGIIGFWHTGVPAERDKVQALGDSIRRVFR